MEAARLQVAVLVTLLALAGCSSSREQAPRSTRRPDKDAMRARHEALALVSKLRGYTLPSDPTPYEAIAHVRLSKTAVTDDDLKVIAGLGCVQHLDLGETGITDEGVRHLARIERLNGLRLSKTKITGEALKYLLRVPGLTYLNVDGTGVQESDLAIFAGHLPPVHYFGSFPSARAWMMPGPFNSSEWAAADDGKLSLRLLALQSPLVPQAPLVVLVELRNDSRGAMNVLRPCGDPYLAEGAWVKIEGPLGPIRYSGPVPSYAIGRGAFETMKSGQIIRDILVLPVATFAGSDKEGEYTITFHYQPSPRYQQTATRPSIDKKDLWTGQIQSKAVTLVKEQ